MNGQIDAIDRLILKELTLNARIPFSQLAEKLSVSNSLIHQRVRKLTELQILKEPVYLVDPVAMGYETCAFTQIMITHPADMMGVVQAISAIPEVVECVNIAGRYAIMVKIYARNNSHLRDVIYERILTIKEVEGTNTTMSFETNFVRSVDVQAHS